MSVALPGVCEEFIPTCVRVYPNSCIRCGRTPEYHAELEIPSSEPAPASSVLTEDSYMLCKGDTCAI